MKRYYYIVISLLLFLTIPIIVQARVYSCDYKEKARLISIASNINIVLDYVETKDTVEFFVTLSNLHPDIYIYDTYKDKEYRYNNKSKNPNELVISNYPDGENIVYEIHSVKANCNSTFLISKYASLPPYNKYYKDPICKELQDFNLCKKWVKNNYNYEEFQQQIDDYLNVKKVEEKNEQLKVLPMHWLLDFYFKYYLYIIASIVSVSLIVVFIKYLRNDLKL